MPEMVCLAGGIATTASSVTGCIGAGPVSPQWCAAWIKLLLFLVCVTVSACRYIATVPSPVTSLLGAVALPLKISLLITVAAGSTWFAFWQLFGPIRGRVRISVIAEVLDDVVQHVHLDQVSCILLVAAWKGTLPHPYMHLTTVIP